MDIKHYLKKLEILKIDPNFYVSEPYLRYSKAHCHVEKHWIHMKEGIWDLFPPIPDFSRTKEHYFIINPKMIWTDFANRTVFSCSQYYEFDEGHTFFDYEYLFDPNDFQNMVGGKWEVFRKNCRKWGKKQEGWSYSKKLKDEEELAALLVSWLESKADSTQDAEIIAQFVLTKDKDVNKAYLYDGKGELTAINVWDQNYKYINYRLCITKRGEPYLEEFVRHLFYIDEEILSKGKLVNDGGVLDSPGLERFKDKMNPVRKRIVYQLNKNK